MLALGRMVMITGDARCPVGSCRIVADVMLCELDEGLVPLYKLSPPVQLARGVEVLFQQHHLMPLDGEVETIIVDEVLANNR